MLLQTQHIVCSTHAKQQRGVMADGPQIFL